MRILSNKVIVNLNINKIEKKEMLKYNTLLSINSFYTNWQDIRKIILRLCKIYVWPTLKKIKLKIFCTCISKQRPSCIISQNRSNFILNYSYAVQLKKSRFQFLDCRIKMLDSSFYKIIIFINKLWGYFTVFRTIYIRLIGWDAKYRIIWQ